MFIIIVFHYLPELLYLLLLDIKYSIYYYYIDVNVSILIKY